MILSRMIWTVGNPAGHKAAAHADKNLGAGFAQGLRHSINFCPCVAAAIFVDYNGLAGADGIEKFRRNRRRQTADEICCPDRHPA
jgi:hypothetical protein